MHTSEGSIWETLIRCKEIKAWQMVNSLYLKEHVSNLLISAGDTESNFFAGEMDAIEDTCLGRSIINEAQGAS